MFRRVRLPLASYIFFFGLCLFEIADAQETRHSGRPLWDIFRTDTTRSARTTYEAIIHPDGRVFAANEGGLVIFDGVRWRTVDASAEKLPLRHISLLPDGSFLGATPDGLGHFSTGDAGQYAWTAISPPNGGLWPAGDAVTALSSDSLGAFVVTERSVFRWAGGKLTPLLSDVSTGAALATPAGLILELGADVLLLKETQQSVLSVPPNWESLEPVKVIGVTESSAVLLTRRSGLFEIQVRDNALHISPVWASLPAPLESSIATTGLRLSNGSFIIGTGRGALLHFSENGELQFQLDRRNGFEAGPMRAVVEERHGNILAFFDGGASYVDVQGRIRIWDTVNGLTSPPTSIALDGPHTFVGTHNGLFRSATAHRMRPVAEAGLEPIGNVTKFPRSTIRGHYSLLLSRDTGLYDFFDDSISQIVSVAARAVHLSRTRPSRIVVATDGAMLALEFERGEWTEIGRIALDRADSITDIDENDEGELITVTRKGQVSFYAADDWLSDTIASQTDPISRQDIPRRPQVDSDPFFVADGRALLLFLHGTPLRWDSRRGSFITDAQLATWAAGRTVSSDLRWLAGSQGNASTWLQTSDETIKTESGRISTFAEIPAGTYDFNSVAMRFGPDRAYFAVPEGVVSVGDTPYVTSPPVIRISGWAVNEGTTNWNDTSRLPILRITQGDKIKLLIGAGGWPKTCGSGLDTIDIAINNVIKRSFRVGPDCEITIDEIPPSLTPAKLEIHARTKLGTVSNSVQIDVRVSVPWYLTSWTILVVAVGAAFVTLQPSSREKSSKAQFARHTSAYLSILCLVCVAALEANIFSTPRTGGEMATLMLVILAASSALSWVPQLIDRRT